MTDDCEPVMVTIELETLRSIEKALRECSEDLSLNIDEKYKDVRYKNRPAFTRRHLRELVPCADAEKCLLKISRVLSRWPEN